MLIYCIWEEDREIEEGVKKGSERGHERIKMCYVHCQFPTMTVIIMYYKYVITNF